MLSAPDPDVFVSCKEAVEGAAPAAVLVVYLCVWGVPAGVAFVLSWM